MWPLVLTSLVAGWAPVVPCLLAPSGTYLEGLLSLLSTLSKAHLGYLHWVSAFLRWAFLFVEKIRIATYCLGPMGKSVDNTKLCWEVVLRIRCAHRCYTHCCVDVFYAVRSCDMTRKMLCICTYVPGNEGGYQSKSKWLLEWKFQFLQVYFHKYYWNMMCLCQVEGF